MALHIVPPALPPEETPARKARKRVAASPKPASMLQCHRCGCREMIQTLTGVMYQAGRSKGGTKSLICADCHRRGERVVVI